METEWVDLPTAAVWLKVSRERALRLVFNGKMRGERRTVNGRRVWLLRTEDVRKVMSETDGTAG